MAGLSRLYEAVFARQLGTEPPNDLQYQDRGRWAKQTACKRLAGAYLNLDDMDDRRVIMAGPASWPPSSQCVTREGGRSSSSIELHKWKKWKGFLKGFFDKYGNHAIIVTRSSRLGGCPARRRHMMGRYFQYRMHPLSVGK